VVHVAAGRTRLSVGGGCGTRYPLKQSSPKSAANTEPLKRALIGCNMNHPAAPCIVVFTAMGFYLNK